MISTTTIQKDRTVSELYDLRYEIEEAYINKDTYLAREQVVRFENIFRFFSSKLTLNIRYSNAISELKLMVFKQLDYSNVQKRLLEEVRRFIMDVNYLSYQRSL